jgi:putative hydrolase of the HAD superfamily
MQSRCIVTAMNQRERHSEEDLGVVFDGDDTLWSTEQLYDEARSRARRIVSDAGIDGVAWEERERQIDVTNVAKFGFSTTRFPTSCVQAYEELCRITGRNVDIATSELIRKEARWVFEHDPPIISGARETLLSLRESGVRLALLTKGDRELQTRRIERSGLRDLFDIIRIVSEKSPAVILDVVAALGVSVSSAWMVGNSMRSDVLPALEAGLRAIWIPAHVWEHEQTYDHAAAPKAITASRLEDIWHLMVK